MNFYQHVYPWLMMVLALVFLASCLSSTISDTPPLEVVKAPGDDGRLVSKVGFLQGLESWNTLSTLEDWTIEGAQVKLNLADGQIVLVEMGARDQIRVRYSLTQEYSQDNSYAIETRPHEDLEIVVVESEESVEFGVGPVPSGASQGNGRVGTRMALVVQRSPLLFTIKRGERVLMQDTAPIRWSANRMVSFKALNPGDRFYGLGEKTGPLQKNGESVKFWNSDTYRYDGKTDPLYLSIPFVMNLREGAPHALFFDNTSQSFMNLGGPGAPQGSWYFGAVAGEMDYTVFAGNQPRDLVRAYTGLTGRMPLPPLWTLGYQQSRYSYMSQEEVLELAQTFRKKKLPVDTLYLDIDFMDAYQSFTVNRENFLQAEAMFKTLKTLNFKTIHIIDPGIKFEGGVEVFDSGKAGDHFVRINDERWASGTVWPGRVVFPDFTRPQTRAWWGPLYKPLVDLGIDAFWNDMNEPSVFNTKHKTLPWEGRHWDFGRNSYHARVHNAYGSEMARATYQGLEKLQSRKRPFVLSRSGYAGLQKWAALWTGDNTSTWEHLRLNVSMVLNLGLSGLAFTGADVGGYSDTPTPELFTRWMQLGALLPLFRNHTEKNTPAQEPWSFGEDAEAQVRSALQLRYQLIPHLYNLMRQSSQTGDPVVRPLFYEFAGDEKTYKIEDQFLLGAGLMAAPVLEEGALKRPVYFPAGTVWFDWYTGQEYRGGETFEVEAPLDRIPLFARAGAIIPTAAKGAEFTSKELSAPQEVRIYPGASNQDTLYWDDGESRDFQLGEYSLWEIEVHFSLGKTQVKSKLVNVPQRLSAPATPFKLLLWNSQSGSWESGGTLALW